MSERGAPKTVAIVGAGFTGSLLAARLLRTKRPLDIVLVESSGRSGRGVAYGTPSPVHLLNVPAGRMSASEDDPDHFVRWARLRRPDVEGGSFLPRGMYGDYVVWVLGEAVRGANPGATFRFVSGTVVDVSPGESGGLVSVDSEGRESAIRADRVVLAIGNLPPKTPMIAGRPLSGPRVVGDPWAPGVLARIGEMDAILVLGTGLTMLDIALELGRQGHRGPILALSRHGLLPQPHRPPRAPYPPENPFEWETPGALWGFPKTARGLLRAVRSEVRRAEERGIDWREVVTALRGVTPLLWQSLKDEEKGRFLRHVRAFWETHRHRAAPAAFQGVQAMIAEGRLTVQAGRLVAAEPSERGVDVAIRPRGGREARRAAFDWVVNGTGPDSDMETSRNALVGNLRTRGLVSPDRLGLGLLTDSRGASRLRDGGASEWLFVAGPLRKAQLWENTAVPELRKEVAALAREIAHYLLR